VFIAAFIVIEITAFINSFRDLSVHTDSRDLSVHPDGQTDASGSLAESIYPCRVHPDRQTDRRTRRSQRSSGQTDRTDMARSTRLVILLNLFLMWAIEWAWQTFFGSIGRYCREQYTSEKFSI